MIETEIDTLSLKHILKQQGLCVRAYVHVSRYIYMYMYIYIYIQRAKRERERERERERDDRQTVRPIAS